MVSEGMLLMAVGMATVFAFLGLLVGLMQGSAAFFFFRQQNTPLMIFF